jgi:hypothetical protein
MNKKNIQNNQSNIQGIIHDVIIVYSNNIEEHFDSIQITDKGFIVGRFIETKFVPFGIIPIKSIKKINKIITKN